MALRPTNAFANPNYLKIGALFRELGLLSGSMKAERAPKRVAISDVLRVGKEIEPRFLAVLPAGLLQAPERFTGLDSIDDELEDILQRLKQGPITFSELRQWAVLPPKDGRRKPVPLKKSMRSFRLSPLCNTTLAELAERKGATETEIVEQLILEARVQLSDKS